MKRSELEHLTRAAGAISGDKQVVIVGSQAVLGQFPDAPAALLASMEADLYPKNRPQLAEIVDGSIGEGSFFHEEFGYYAQGVGPETAVLPDGWENRLVPVNDANTGGTEGCALRCMISLSRSMSPAGRKTSSSLVRLRKTNWSITRRSSNDCAKHVWTERSAH